jgi:hypothetical protein
VPELPAGQDNRLWLVLKSYPGKSLIFGNAHTFPGRMLAWNIEAGAYVKFSKSDILDSSELSKAWLSGFLAGSEPSITDVAGKAGEPSPDPDEEDVRRWEAVVARYRESGVLSNLARLPLAPMPPDTPTGPAPWLATAGEILTWTDDGWEFARGQIRLAGNFLAGSVCADREYHDISQVSEDYLVCDDCGMVTELA